MGVDDQNDSLINELADFLNGTPNKYDYKESNVDHVNNENDLNKAIINDNSVEYINQNSKKTQQNFREITEKQILQSNNEIDEININNNLEVLVFVIIGRTRSTHKLRAYAAS